MMMRRLIMVLGAMLAVSGAVAQESAWQLLGRVSAYMNSEAGYEVQFEIRTADYSSEGSYRVKGNSYHIEVAGAEVYSDGEVRYEVDGSRKEVNIDVMDSASRNILDNPTRCFDFVEDDYVAEVVSRDAESVKLKLQAKDKAVEGDIYITVSAKSAAPTKLEYVLYGDRVEVVVRSIDHKVKSVKKFDRSAYKDFEIIDFR